jgi:hypothetical protein
LKETYFKKTTDFVIYKNDKSTIIHNVTFEEYQLDEITWNIEQLIKISKNTTYPTRGQLEQARMMLRKVAEALFRIKYGYLFKNKPCFGNIIDKIERSKQTDELYKFKDDLRFLSPLNSFTQRKHHISTNNFSIVSEQLNLPTIQMYTEKVLELKTKISI